MKLNEWSAPVLGRWNEILLGAPASEAFAKRKNTSGFYNPSRLPVVYLSARGRARSGCKAGQTLSRLVKVGQGWSRLVKVGQGWSRLVKVGQGWAVS